MSLGIGVSPSVAALLTAIGITDDNGRLRQSWFDHPLDAIGRILADPAQRAALLQLLDQVLPADPDLPGWHPLLDHDLGNLYLTVTDDVVGVAAALHSGVLGSGVGVVRGSVRLPLMDFQADLRPIAGTAEGPVSVGVELEFTGSDLPLTAVGAAVDVDVDNGAAAVITLRDVAIGDATPVDVIIDSATMGADLLTAVRLLIKEVVDALAAEAGADPLLVRLADHLFELLGLGTGTVPPFPLDQVFDRPAAVVDWLIDIVDAPDTLIDWATQLAGLIGDDLPVTGDATPAVPFRARLVDSSVVALDLIIQLTPDRELEFGLDALITVGGLGLSAVATVLRIPLPALPGQPGDPAAAGRTTQVVPVVTVGLSAPATGALIDDPPTLQVGTVTAGFQLLDGQLRPWLRASGVTIDGEPHGDVDLTDADAVIAVASDAALAALEDGLGDSPAARAVLTLLGLRRPDDDPTTPHLLTAVDLARGPLTALATLHREILADPVHSWSPLFGQIAAMVGLDITVTGSGTPQDPWVVPIASAGPVSLGLAAWNARTDSDPDGLQRLRLGLRAHAERDVFAGGLAIELLGADLPASGAGTVNLIGRSQLTLTLTPAGPFALSGLQVTSGPLTAAVGWRPGEPPDWRVGLLGVTVTIDQQQFGPYALGLPAAAPDLGFGADAITVMGRLLSAAVRSWGGDTAYRITALLGLHRDLPGLPADWPLLADVVTGAGSFEGLLADPAAALRGYLGRLISGVSADGTAFAIGLLQTLAGLLPTGSAASAGSPAPTDLSALRSITGHGRYDDPWTIPVINTTGDLGQGVTGVDLLAWLDPAGPPAGWIAALAQAADAITDGDLLTDFLAGAAAFRPGLAGLLAGRDAGALGTAFSDLAGWLTAGDGLVALTSQLPDGWTHGTVVASPHSLLPSDPQVISQIVARLAAGTGPVLLVAPPFTDHTMWSELVVALTGAPQAAGTHVDLRALPNPADVDLAGLTAIAAVYTADLLADQQALSEADQLQRVVDRIHTLTGKPVRVVGHSTAGVVARRWAAAHPGLAADLITLAAPHAGTDLGPLTDDALSDAVRVGASVAAPIADTALGGALCWLAGLLDGAGGPMGAAINPDWFAGAGDLVDPLPGLAIGSQLSGDLIGLLTGATVSGLAAGDPPTHLAFGIRLRLDTPPVVDKQVAVNASARVDVARLRFADGPEPTRPATAVSVDLDLMRTGGWLVGDGVLAVGPASAKVRRVEAGVTVIPAGAAGGLDLRPRLRLVDAAVRSGLPAVDLQLGDTALQAALDAVCAELAAAAAQPAVTALDLLRAAGAVIDTDDGPRACLQGITDLATVPIRTLTGHRAALLEAVRGLIGLPSGAPLQVGLPELPIRLSLDDTTLVLRLETTADIDLGGPLRAGWRLDLDTRTLAVSLDSRLAAGPLDLHRSTDGSITAAAPPWLDQLTLRPYDPATLRIRLLQLLPDLAVSAVAGGLLGALAAGPIMVPPISGLIRDPVGWLKGQAALGTDAGRLDGAKINTLLTTIADALGLDGSQGLGLPGGFLITAAGTDPLHLSVSGSLGHDTLGATVQLGVDLSPAGPVTPAGGITLHLALPGSWGDLIIAFSVDATGVGLVITPSQIAPIRLLPAVSGLGDLLGSTATALVPVLLDKIVDALQTAGGDHQLLDTALQIAEQLGIYTPPPGAGFSGTAQIQRLKSMLDPGWLQSQVSDPASIMDAIAGLFPTIIPLPAGHTVTRIDDRLRWQVDLLPGCRLGAELGWAADGRPQLMITLDGLDTGPVTVVSARLGYLDDFEGLVLARLDVGDPLAFFTPEMEFSLSAGRLAARILPLGTDAAADAAIVLAPAPAVILTTAGGLRLAGSWLLPLLTRYVVPQVEALITTPLWTGGPTAQHLLAAAGLLTADTGPVQVALDVPTLPQMGLGALEAALAGVTVSLPAGLTLAAAQDAGRFGLRLTGQVSLPADDVTVTVLFGSQDWIGADAGVTAWLIADAPADAEIPVVVAPGLDLAGLGLQITGAADSPLVGGHDGDGGPLRIGGIAASLFLGVDFWDSGHATFAVDGLGAAVELIDAAIQVDGSDGDAFVSKIIPAELAAGFSITIAYRHDQLEVHGGPGDLHNGIALTFPLNLNILDLIFLRELYLAALFGQGHTDVIAALSGNATLGPLAVDVTRVGLRAAISSSGAGLAFKPPDGFGLSIDASVIRLGGFLLVDEARGRYVGALEIAVLQKFQLTAIGVVTTKKPDGSPGFSLLMLVTVSLPVPIPLGYGFFFSGAGGLLGLNRGMDVDRIRDGLRTGTADSILFPTDIINRIDVIIRDLEESFPQADGHFLIAPVGMIQWMNPALVTLKIGIILEIAPQPNVALLGVLRLALPTTEEAVVDLKVAFLGGIDVAAGLLYFDAAIYDSFIGYGDFKLSLEGDIAIRLSWGANPDLVASIGGFHPSYTPAAGLHLPAMRRITLSLLKDNPRLTLKLYFAVTSNTIQFGAELEFFAGVSGFSISGDLGFDVLVQFVPFLIDAHLWGRLAVTAGGTDICSISLDLRLRGPTPWYAHGTASISILFFSISVDVEATFGETHESSIPGEPVLPKVLDQLRDPLNWVAELTAAASAGVTLLPLPSDALVVDAGGLLAARQNLIPLRTDIGLVGKTPPTDVRRVAITGLAFGTGADTETVEFADVTAPFSPSTFAGATSTDADLLKAPSFEQRPNGVRATVGERLGSDFLLAHQQTYEMIVIDDPDAETPPAVPAVPALAFSKLVSGGAIGASAAAGLQRKRAERGSVVSAVAAEPRFAVTTVASLVGLDDRGQPDASVTVLLTRTDAEQRRNALAATDGVRYQIVPEAQIVQ